MSDHARRTYALCLRYFAELAALGVRDVVISPGSRSTPLALAAATVALRVTVRIDERVAAFHALGIGKATGLPAVLVCTSGTALANHLPAVVEAHHAGVPLIVCSGDRPPELRRQGAGQTIDQPGIFGSATRWFHEVAVASEIDERHGRALARRSFEHAAVGRGPVHLDWPFRKPLDPDGPLIAPAPTLVASRPPVSAPSPLLAALADDHERGLIVVGPTDLDGGTLAEIAAFAARAGWPIVADPASGLRSTVVAGAAAVVVHADLFLASPGLDPGAADVVVRVGLSPTSAVLQRWLDAHEPARTVLVDPGTDWPDPSAVVTDVVAGPLRGVFAVAAASDGEPHESDAAANDLDAADRTWSAQWLAADRVAAAALDQALAGDAGELAATAAVVAAAASAGADLVVSSSMPIRVVDAVAGRLDGDGRIWSNRGANGIDGVIATAAGIASGTGRVAVALVGDVAAVHDLGGLAAAIGGRAAVVVVVLDNDGGSIFSMLPVRDAVDAAVFDQLFTTPHGTDIVAVAAALGCPARSVPVDEVGAAVAEAIAAGGPALVRVAVPGGGAAPAAIGAIRASLADLDPSTWS